MSEPVLTIVVPCYNEEEVLPITLPRLMGLLKGMIGEQLISPKSRLLFVDDGSKDRTWEIIYKETLKNELVKGLKLAVNAGHQNALLAGIFTAKAASDCIISIDADLQDDPSAIPEFIRKYNEGCEVVYGVRKSRESDTWFKRFTAQGFYKLMAKMGVNLVYNHADFRLLGKRAVNELERFREVNMFLRGVVPLIGFKSAEVYYDRCEREAGESKYPLRKMLAFAFDGITSFSITPIRLVLIVGIASSVISILSGISFLFLKFFGETETGWTSLIISIWLIGGLQLIAIGLIGEYIGKIYKESKQRPKFVVDIDMFNLPLNLKNESVNGMESYQLDSRQYPETN
ncbi:glycosyltransferase [Neobacillus notoginsengisoli]|uniref:Glycosyltransferase n=1 Tax=Neobacillus notoginsengisoli TaxID=1578198 RepID=A0A417YYB2_9BACI|nr:glycosyltransferase family 2 protein [Neobacillus notoginsengisoli]RHW42603.1 glycosyltransferase [Neobacillus notoginsengisoli]